MATPEGKVKDMIKKELNQYVKSGDMYYHMPIGGAYSKKGVPDFIGSYKGQFWAIEAKAPGGKTTELQDIALDSIEKSGGIQSVVYDKETMKIFLENLLK